MKNFTNTFLMPMATRKEKTSNNNYICGDPTNQYLKF